MLLVASGTTRADWYDEELEKRLEKLLDQLFVEDIESCISDTLIAARLSIHPDLSLLLLLEQVTKSHLVPQFFWYHDDHVAMEAAQVSDFPRAIDCAGCGQLIQFSASDVFAAFVINPQYAALLNAGTR